MLIIFRMKHSIILEAVRVHRGHIALSFYETAHNFLLMYFVVCAPKGIC
jgi:hypothetical protein